MPSRARVSKPKLDRICPVLAARDSVQMPGNVQTLYVIRESSIRATEEARRSNGELIVLSQRDTSVEDPKVDDLYSIGVLCEVLHATQLADGSQRVALKALRRIRAIGVSEKKGAFFGEFEDLEEVPSDEISTEALMRLCVQGYSRLVVLNKEIPAETLAQVRSIEDPGLLADTIANHLALRTNQKQLVLEELRHAERLFLVSQMMGHEEEVLQIQKQFERDVERQVSITQRQFLVREQIRLLQKELNEPEDLNPTVAELKARVANIPLPDSVRQKLRVELDRLARFPDFSTEFAVAVQYVETLCTVPWFSPTLELPSLAEVNTTLVASHYGLEGMKHRILEHLAVRLTGTGSERSVLCLVGPPGVGKTSVCQAIANALRRPLVRIALGGVKDTAELRGHRRTYVGALPGRIMGGLIQAGRPDAVVLLDEIDKADSSGGNELYSTLLEVLDPSQNHQFQDHYLEQPFDLSRCLFIATANSFDKLPSALKDRFETILMQSYSQAERYAIAEQFLIPQAANSIGLLAQEQPVWNPEAIHSVVEHYTQEAGVRSLTRCIDSVYRRLILNRALGQIIPEEVTNTLLREILGESEKTLALREQESIIGRVYSMVVTEAGGNVMEVEAALLPTYGENPVVQLTGTMGETMRESALAAISLLRERVPNLGPKDVHIHMPMASVSKDGPSAGLAIFLALYGRATGKAWKSSVAVTGEITLGGRILAVGGVRDKVLAALRLGATLAIVPAQNQEEVEKLGATVHGLSVHYVETIDDCLNLLQE